MHVGAAQFHAVHAEFMGGGGSQRAERRQTLFARQRQLGGGKAGRLQPGLDKGVGYAQLLIGADAGDDGAAHLRNYESLQQQAKQALTGVVFQIQARPEDADLAAAMATWLNASGIRTDQSQARGSNLLAISSSSRNDQIYDSKLTKLMVTLRVSDDQGRTLASREFTVSGTSAYDYRGARQNAIQKLVTTMREAGPVASLGFTE